MNTPQYCDVEYHYSGVVSHVINCTENNTLVLISKTWVYENWNKERRKVVVNKRVTGSTILFVRSYRCIAYKSKSNGYLYLSHETRVMFLPILNREYC